MDRIFSIGHSNPTYSGPIIAGTVSKFPITPDRIPDFCSAAIYIGPIQSTSRMSFVELKRPNALLYTGRRLISKGLNIAWIECVETRRLITDIFRDFLRRLVKALDEKCICGFDNAYGMLEKAEPKSDGHYSFRSLWGRE